MTDRHPYMLDYRDVEDSHFFIGAEDSHSLNGLSVHRKKNLSKHLIYSRPHLEILLSES